MPSHTLEELLARQQELLAQQQALQQQPDPGLNLGLLSEGQSSIGDALRNPDTAQVSGILNLLAGAVNPKGPAPAATAAVNALSGFAGARASDQQTRRTALERRGQNLKDQLAAIRDATGTRLSVRADTRAQGAEERAETVEERNARLFERVTLPQGIENLNKSRQVGLTQANVVVPTEGGGVQTVAVQRDSQGRFYDIQGNPIQLPVGTVLGTTGKTAEDLEAGGFGLTTAQRGQAQKRILGAEKQLREITKLTTDDLNKFLSLKGRAVTALGKGTDFLQGLGGEKAADVIEVFTDVNPTEFAAESRVVFERLANFFNEYRKDITGAAAAFVELEKLKEGVLNGDLPPAQAIASLNALVERTLGNIEADKLAISGGVRGANESSADKVRRIRGLLNE